MECESYNLNWAEFNTYTSKTFKDLLSDQNFSDVTLVCDDEETIQAHKVILSACSPFFNRILTKNQHNHPLVYLSDVNLNELKAIVNFMYLGQTNVEQENLQRFLKIAAKFQVRGLTDNNSNRNEEQMPSPAVPTRVNKSASPKKVVNFNNPRHSLIQNPELLEESYNTESQMNNSNMNENIKVEPDAEVSMPMFDDREELENVDNIDTSQFAIENMMSLTPTVTVDGDKTYPCDQCDYKATYACNLTSHKRTVHQGLYYSCTLCPYKSSRKDRLNKHIASKHSSSENSF